MHHRIETPEDNALLPATMLGGVLSELFQRFGSHLPRALCQIPRHIPFVCYGQRDNPGEPLHGFSVETDAKFILAQENPPIRALHSETIFSKSPGVNIAIFGIWL